MALDAIRSIERGFEQLNCRLDDLRDVGSQRHEENVEKLSTLEHEARQLSGSVSEAHRKLATQEEQIRNLYRLARDWQDAKTHAIANAPTLDGENITLGRLKWYLVVYGSGAGTMLGLMKILGKI